LLPTALPALAFAVFVAVLVAATAAWIVGPPLWQRWRRARIAATPFPPAWRRVLRERWPLYARLPPPLQRQVQRQVRWLLAEVPIVGCAGLVVTDTMRVLIAAQAALLWLNRGGRGFPALREVLVYPGAFVVDRVEPGGAGLAHEGPRVLSGESWQRGQVVLSWADVAGGAADAGDGRNVVIHEFAHQLDQAHGSANGAPWLGRGAERYARWSAVLGQAYAELRERLATGQADAVLDPYAATDPAEFFAVASEHFFEQPHALAAAHPALYAELVQCYRADPRAWW
jgi:Mlc titration factor MtfA (ptsG expression regulator)